MQVRDLLQPATVLNDRHTLADAVNSIEQRIPVFVRFESGWGHVAPDDVAGYPSSRRMIDLPVRRVAPVAPDTDLRSAMSEHPTSPIAVEEFGEIIGCLDPQRLSATGPSINGETENARLLLHVLEPIAHDLGNALFALAASIDGLDESILNQDVLTCRAAMRHASSVLQKLRAICSGAIEGAPNRIDVTRTITGMLDVLRVVAGPGVQLSVDLRQPLPLTTIYERALERSLLNLVLNACRAMKHNGRIHITARVDETLERSWISIMVEDDGPGLSSETAERLFAAAHRPTPGTRRGLGLASVAQALGRVGGHLTTRPSRLGGAAMELRLPVQDASRGSEA